MSLGILSCKYILDSLSWKDLLEISLRIIYCKSLLGHSLGSLSLESLLGNSLEKLACGNGRKNPKDNIFPEDRRCDLLGQEIKGITSMADLFLPKWHDRQRAHPRTNETKWLPHYGGVLARTLSPQPPILQDLTIPYWTLLYRTLQYHLTVLLNPNHKVSPPRRFIWFGFGMITIEVNNRVGEVIVNQ